MPPRLEIVCPFCSTPKAVRPGTTRLKLDCHGCGREFESNLSPPPPQSDYPTSPSVSSPPALLANRYLLGREIGRGSCGVVHEATDSLQSGRKVAVKRLLEVNSPDAAERIRREAEIMSRITHPNILTVLDYGTDVGSHYLVMQLVEGQPLRNRIGEHGLDDPRQAVRLMIQVCRALHHAFSKHGILHRDVKPGNILLLPDDESLYLMDFGLAAFKDEAAAHGTAVGTVLGTPAYMPPEQARGDLQAICHQSDLYGAAAVLYHLLTGKVPFPGPPPMVFQTIQHAPLKPPSALRPGLGSGLDGVVARALAKRPQDRYADCGKLADALDSWLKTGAAKPKAQPKPLLKAIPADGPLKRPASENTTTYPPTPAAGKPWWVWALALTLGVAVVGGGLAFALKGGNKEPPKKNEGDKKKWGL